MGQRIIHFNTPQDLADINDKGELSIHNISTLAPWFTLGKLVAGIYGVFGIFIFWILNRWWDISLLELFVVPVFLSSPFLVVLMMRLLRLTILENIVPLGYAEVEELFLANGIAVFTIYVQRRVYMECPRV